MVTVGVTRQRPGAGGWTVVTVLLPYGAVEPQPAPGKVHTMQHISTHTPDIHFTLDTGFPPS